VHQVRGQRILESKGTHKTSSRSVLDLVPRAKAAKEWIFISANTGTSMRSRLCLNYLESKKCVVGLSFGGNLTDAPTLAKTEWVRKEFASSAKHRTA